MQPARACASAHVCTPRRRPRSAFVDAPPALGLPLSLTVPADAPLTLRPPAAATPAVFAAGAATPPPTRAGGGAADGGADGDDDAPRGRIRVQDKFGLLLSVCSVLVSVQVLMPRVL